MRNLLMGTVVGVVVLFAVPVMAQWRYTDGQGVVKTEQFKSRIPADYRDAATWAGPTGPSSIPQKATKKCSDGVSIPGGTVMCPEEIQKRARDEADTYVRRSQDAARQSQEARQQHSAAFMQASATCNRAQNGFGNHFDAVARPDGTVRMVGTARERFDFETCMEKAGFPLNSK